MVRGAYYTNPGTREENEDSVFIVERAGNMAAVVADGLGGQGGGQRASSIAVEELCRFFEQGDKQVQLKKWFDEANRRILGEQKPGMKMMSTAVALYLTDGQAMWAHMGDSRLYHFIDGRLVWQSLDHSVSQMAVLRGEITQDQVRFHEDRNRVLRALGGDDEARPEIGEAELDGRHHAFLLCTDGFWEYIREEQMEQTLKASESPEKWIEIMCGMLPPLVGERDNFTAATVFFARED